MIKPYVLSTRPKELMGVKPLVTHKGYKFYILGDIFYLFRPITKYLVGGCGYREYRQGKTPSHYIVFDGFTKYTALELINSFVGKNDSIFYDGVFKLYGELGLPIGYTRSILKDL